MSRRTGIDDSQLISIVETYKELKDTENGLKKQTTDLNEQIKALMAEYGLTEFSTGKYIATITEKENEVFDESRAIDILKNSLTKEQIKKVIKTKEYIDDDELEKLIYNKDFDVQLLSPCKSVTSVTKTLRIKKEK